MKKRLIIFFQIIIILIGIGAFTFLLWEPHIEGRNVNATLFEIYFNDPFLAYTYIGSIAFFVGIYKAFKLLGYIGKNETLSVNSIRALRTIKYCAITIIGFIIGAEAYLFIAMRTKDDIAGGVAMGIFIIVISAIIGSTATVFQRILQNKQLKNNAPI